MPRLLESEITKYLETLEDSEDGLDGSDSEVEDEGHYYQTARDFLRDLVNSDKGENAQSDEVDADPPLVIDKYENMPDPPILEAEEAAPQSRSQGISKRPLVWRKRNLITTEDSLIFRGETQITEALMSCNTPYDFFSFNFASDLKKQIVEQSNLYAAQKQISNSENINENILNKFLGILIYTSVIKFSNTRAYWSEKFGYDHIKNTMPLKKIEKIRSTLHFAEDTVCLPKDHPDYDRLFKIRPLEETPNCQFGKVPLDQRLSIDEQMCATKMSHYIKQYMPNKPHKCGFKLYLICSLQGYARRFEVYSGGGSKNNILPGEPDLGESGNTVVSVTSGSLQSYNEVHDMERPLHESRRRELPSVRTVPEGYVECGGSGQSTLRITTVKRPANNDSTGKGEEVPASRRCL
ncbi:unnamed protein product [Arctia plantaginis]|uniref:PiggyBac transposable element-derived protein domain-containing protein n=1 Tax=Arctia plantaginis TaxID=874455 RepID=A0A8S0YRK5_ARCPL|nr:unnamed protein product [Arctia plantaginis]